MTTPNSQALGGSFRDPSGFLFEQDGTLYRQVNLRGQEDYDLFMGSGLYARLVEKKLLVPHQEAQVDSPAPALCYKILQPERVPFISYPYEWSFGQLKSAARATLNIQKLALEAGMTLKDASAYNIQFVQGRAKLIDTLSFEVYQPGQPWSAYRQFCQHFLAPLALMAYRDIHLSSLLRVYIDGIPLELVSKLLPRRTVLNPGLLMHLHLHANSVRKYSDELVKREAVSGKMSKTALLGLVDSLLSVLKSLKVRTIGTDWADYYDQTNYTSAAFEDKQRIVAEYLSRSGAHTVWDLGANTGVFSRLATQAGMQTISFDIDPAAVEKNYRQCVKEKETHMLPLVMDFTNPSPGIGWHHQERLSLMERGPADAALALALIHHLVIGNNVPLPKAARFFRDCCEWLIIEFIPKGDSQIEKMLAMRKDIFDDYHQQGFEEAFRAVFEIVDSAPVSETQRRVYLMRRR
jgi:hypothetical protein